MTIIKNILLNALAYNKNMLSGINLAHRCCSVQDLENELELVKKSAEELEKRIFSRKEKEAYIKKEIARIEALLVIEQNNSPYHGEWTSWEDVMDCFKISHPEPKTVIFASYNNEDCSGSASVVYYDGGKIYLVEESHRSDCSLSGQWQTVDYDPLVFQEAMERWRENDNVAIVKKRFYEFMKGRVE